MSVPIVFLGPSLPRARARQLLDADYRPPARRGDFDRIGGGAVVGLIDGVFDQHLAVSPTEIRRALERGVTVFGASSMGALRANEVPGVVGVGRVYQMYRSGEVEDDDEVAVTFDPDSDRCLSVPMVNVRHAVDRLVRPGTLSPDDGRRIVAAAKALPYPDRVYPLILKQCGLSGRADASLLHEMLTTYDLKGEDAITLLEELRGARPGQLGAPAETGEGPSGSAARTRFSADAAVAFWEFGPPLPFSSLVEFMKLTGCFEPHARAAWARLPQLSRADDEDLAAARRAELQRLRTVWHWTTSEEVSVTLSELGLGTRTLEGHLQRQAALTARLMATARAPARAALEALRAHLFGADAALKREVARCQSLELLAARGRAQGAPLPDERMRALDVVCRGLDCADEPQALALLGRWGVSPAALEAHLERLCCAARAVIVLGAPRAARRIPSSLLPRAPKQPGDARFCWPLGRAQAVTRRLANVIGVTRVALITGLGGIGVPNAQAFRPGGRWSSTVGSGKSTSKRGARVGAVMEELEKWAQEQFEPPSALRASCSALTRQGCAAVDPATLDLPWDSGYHSGLELDWVYADELVGGGRVLLPLAMVTYERQPADVLYSPRSGRKLFTSNGLASGFTRAEALTHALCECVERHALIFGQIVEANPGAPYARAAPRVDLATVPPSSARLIRRIRRAGYEVRVRDLSGPTGVPTFHATVLARVGGALSYQEDWKEQVGHAAHPDPTVALDMALLEATQSLLSDTAGAREDLTLHARSLGRHERSKVRRWSAYVAARAPDWPQIPWNASQGFRSRDAAEDVRWLCRTLAARGFAQICAVDLSRPELAPTHVVRVVVPNMETVNPFFTGPRSRAALLEDLL